MRIPIDPPKYIDLIESLHKHSLTPAIVFLTSRRACDEAVESFRGTHFPEIPPDQKKQIEAVVEQFGDEADFIRGRANYKILLGRGVAAHHAGHLPAWKHAVEKLMSAGLLRAVFATSTLAAGIDMPARSVVITASSLRSDDGHRDIKAFELAQMTGRAGRRGRDKIGFAVFIPGPFQDLGVIRERLAAPPEPLESRFTSNYTMVLNLLQQLTPESARSLVERSFRQFQNLKPARALRPRIERMQAELDADAASCPAGNRAATLAKFTELDRHHARLNKQVKSLRRTVARQLDTAPPAWAETLVEGLQTEETRLKTLAEKRGALPCGHCPQLKGCPTKAGEMARLDTDLRRHQAHLHEFEHGLWAQFEDCVHILQFYGYLTDDWRPTDLGVWASRLRVDNTLFIAELLRGEFFAVPNARTLAALCGGLMAEDREFLTAAGRDEPYLKPLRKAMQTARSIATIQEKFSYFCPMYIDPNAARLLWAWGDDRRDWTALLDLTDATEGDIVRLILRTSDLLGQLAGLSDSHPDIAGRAREAIRLIRRPPIED